MLMLGLPPILSLYAGHYIGSQLAYSDILRNFANDVQIDRIDFDHGWFSSHARIDFRVSAQNSVIRTRNRIIHGPIVWPRLVARPLESLSLYEINTLFDVSADSGRITGVSDEGFARTRIGYTGSTKPVINHPGLATVLFGSHFFADLPEVKGEILSDGTGFAVFSANQVEIVDRYSTIYATQPGVELSFESHTALPSQLQVNALNVSGSIGVDEFGLNDFILSGILEKNESRYAMQTKTTSGRLTYNDAAVNHAIIEFSLSGISQDLAAYFSSNYMALSAALQNNQWLIVLEHFSKILKHLNKHEPQISLQARGMYANQPVTIEFFGKLVTHRQSRLNPFSMLENLEIKLDIDIPQRLMHEINRPELTELVVAMSDKGLLVNKNESYYSKLSFQGAKLTVAHDIL